MKAAEGVPSVQQIATSGRLSAHPGDAAAVAAPARPISELDQLHALGDSKFGRPRRPMATHPRRQAVLTTATAAPPPRRPPGASAAAPRGGKEPLSAAQAYAEKKRLAMERAASIRAERAGAQREREALRAADLAVQNGAI